MAPLWIKELGAADTDLTIVPGTTDYACFPEYPELEPRQWGHMISFRLSTLRARGDPRLSPGGVCRKRAVARHGLPVQRGAAPGMEIQVGKIVGDTNSLDVSGNYG